MKWWRRIKNLWRLSAYRPVENKSKSDFGIAKSLYGGPLALTKDFLTIEKRSAVIISDKPDFFEEHVETD